MKLSHRVSRSMSWFSDHADPVPGYPNGVLEMDKAENWLVRSDMLRIIKDAVSSNLEPHHLSYSQELGGPPGLLQNSASFFNRFFSPQVAVLPEHIVTGAGCASVLESLIFSICDVGDGLLLEAPMWAGFGVTSILRNNVRIIPVKNPRQPTSVEDFMRPYNDAMEHAMCPIRGVIVCNPQNPFGQIYPTEWLGALLQFCENHDIHFISDEIYALSNFGVLRLSRDVSNSNIVTGLESTFTSALAVDLKRLQVNPMRVHVVYSISKDLGSSGIRLGFLVTQSNPEIRYALAVLNKYRVSNLASIVVTALFSNLQTLENVLSRSKYCLRIAAEVVCGFLSFHGLSFYSPVAGCFMWARIGGEKATTETDAELVGKLAAARVAVAVGSKFGGGEPGWFRLTFALPRENLIEGLRRIEIAMEAKEHWKSEKIDLARDWPCT